MLHAHAFDYTALIVNVTVELKANLKTHMSPRLVAFYTKIFLI